MKCFVYLALCFTCFHLAVSVKRKLPTARPSTKKARHHDDAAASGASAPSSSSASTGDVLKKFYLYNKLSAKDIQEILG